MVPVTPNSEVKLFQPIKIGSLQLSHRIVLAPLTRTRSSDTHVPADYAADYYGQRASTPGTLLITEATYIAQRAVAYSNTPGVWNDEQIAAWKKVMLGFPHDTQQVC